MPAPLPDGRSTTVAPASAGGRPAAMLTRMGRVILVACLGLAASARAATYLTQEEALALAFQNPSQAQKHSILFDDAHRKIIEQKLGEKSIRRGILAFTGELKSGGKGVVLFDAVIGKHELIDYMVALGADGRVRFIEVLAYREGYGGEIRQQNWRDQFAGKSEKDPPEHEGNIVNISGATLSCRHVTEGVRQLLIIANVYAEELGIR